MSCIQSVPAGRGSCGCSRFTPAAGPAGAILVVLRRVVHRIGDWTDRARQRRALAMLDRRLLADAGIPPEAAVREAAKPFWQD